MKRIGGQFFGKNQLRYLDANNVSGVFSVAKFVSFAQMNEFNTSIATDGDYIYLYLAVPMKPMMYKIGTGTSDKTIAGKIYLSKKAEKEGDVCWTYCQGRLYFRRANEEFGVVTMYDAETLSLIGDAKLLSEDVFTD